MVTRETNITTEVEVETEVAIEVEAEAATVRVKTNITTLREHNKTNVIKVASNNMAITRIQEPKDLMLDKKVETKERTSSSNSNNSFSFHKLTFPTLTLCKVTRERTSLETVSIQQFNKSMENQSLVSSPVCSWTNPPLTPRSFSPTISSS